MIDATELLLYDVNSLKNPDIPCWSYEPFDLDLMKQMKVMKENSFYITSLVVALSGNVKSRSLTFRPDVTGNAHAVLGLQQITWPSPLLCRKVPKSS